MAISCSAGVRALACLALCFSFTRCTHERGQSTSEVRVNPVAASLAPSIKLDAQNPSTCEPCHGAVVEEWRESLHSRAHHERDPLYAAMRTMRTQRQGAHIPAQCANCHNPNEVNDHESPQAKAGVSCATCHQISAVHAGPERKGVAAMTVSPEVLFRGPHDLPDGVSPVHHTGAALSPLQDGKSLCLACHGEERNAAGVSSCSTGIEHSSLTQTQSCTACHMAEVPTPSGAVSQRPTHRSHRFWGPHQAQRLNDASILAEAVDLSAEFSGESVQVRVANRSGHAFPTGFPARMTFVEVRLFDASGAEVSRNISSEPMKEHPEAVLNKGYVDAEGRPSLAPFAVKLVRDNRLQAGETRMLSVKAPPQARRAEIRLKFFLVAPPAAKMMGYEGPETKPLISSPIIANR